MRAKILISILATTILAGCGESISEPLDPSSVNNGQSAPRSLYVTSGGCYAGGVTTTVGSNTVAILDADNGNLKRVLVDYATFSPGDTPVAIAEYDHDRIVVAVENAAGRRLDLVRKDGSGINTYLVNTTALSGVLRAMKMMSDGTLLISKSTAIEKFSSARTRVTQGANPYVSAPGSTCATTATLIAGFDTLSNGKIVYAHSAATPNNKLAVISTAGYATTADCLGAQAAPTTLAMPTAVLALSSGKVLVSYGSTTAASNSIYSYDIDPATNIIGSVTSAYADIGVVNGPSAMAQDPVSGLVYVANGAQTANTIERFRYNDSSRTLTRVGSTLQPNIYTRCISSMKLLRDK